MTKINNDIDGSHFILNTAATTLYYNYEVTMWWITAFLLFVLMIILYLLFAPFYIEVNSITSLYRIRFHHLASISLKPVNGSVTLELNILFWKKQLNRSQNNEPGIQRIKDEKNKKTRKRSLSMQTLKNLLMSFKLNTFDVLLDTGDVTLNGKLYPFFYLLGIFIRKPVQINFTGQSHIILEIENSLARLALAFIRSK